MASKNLDAVSVEIKVAGKACDYVTMELNQSVSMHHRFKIKVNYRPDKPSGGCELFISQYQPYTGTYITYVLESNLSDRRLLLAKLEDILADRRSPYLWSHNIYKRNIFSIDRNYQARYTSMRSGNIATPRQSKFFGR
jgi:hypothetical protein